MLDISPHRGRQPDALARAGRVGDVLERGARPGPAAGRPSAASASRVDRRRRPSVYVLADRQRLKQVLLNLLPTPSSTTATAARSRVAVRSRRGRRDCASRSPTPGRASRRRTLERLFSPFERLGAERTGVEGTGLGLALSRRLVEAMGGDASASRASPAPGSTFWIELRAAEPARRHGRGRRRDVRGATGAARRHARTCSTSRTTSPTSSSSSASSAPAGVELIAGDAGPARARARAAHRPDLILLDLHLPDMRARRSCGGSSATRAPSTSRWSSSSGRDATDEAAQGVLAAGAADYLTKPLDMHEFLGAVRRTLAKSP